MAISWPIGATRAGRMTIAFALSVGVCLAGSAQAYAGGALAEPIDSQRPTRLSEESAIVSMADGVERIDLRLSLNSPEVHTGLIIPTPTPATVSGGSPNDFTYVAREIVPTRINTDLWWRWPPRKNPDAPSTTETTVVNRIHLGVIQATALEPEDGETLDAWLEKNEYQISPDARSRLAHYIDKGWSFTAVKLTASYPLTGDLAPIRIEFETDTFVYPLFLTLGNADALDLRLNIFSDHRTTISSSHSAAVDHEVIWAKKVRDNALKSLGAYLTVIDMSFENPRSSPVGDLSITRAETDEEVGTQVVVEHYMTVLGIPIAWVILFLSLAIMAAVLTLTLRPYHPRV